MSAPGGGGLELGDPAAVVEMDRDDLARHHGRQVHGVFRGHPAAVPGHQLIALAADLHARSVEQDPAVLRHRPPPR
jgi:hypothetical protein